MTILFSFRLCSSLALVLYGLSGTMAQTPISNSETREPAFLLRPRHYNFHPYESARSSVLHSQNFIYNPLPSQYNLFPLAFASGLDQHPYNIIKGRQDLLGRQRQSENDSRSFSALARTAQKVLAAEATDEEKLNRKYEFVYTANDGIYHSQQQDDQGLVKGSYEVPLPDGRIQVVQYTADDNGYHPEISYKEAAFQSPAALPNRISSAPVQRGSVVVYPPDEEEEDQEQQRQQDVAVEAPQSYYSSTTTSGRPYALQYTNYGLLSGLQQPYGTARPAASANQQKGHIQYATYEDVEASSYYQK